VTRSDVIDQLLDDQRFHIEFNGHLTNHAKHAVVALAGLGAPPEKIKAYYDDYVKLTSYGFGLEPARTSNEEISEVGWDRFLGARAHYPAYCDFFDQRVRELGLDEVVRRYVPRLLPGWVGSFTHAAIHLGWALDVGSRWMAVEGLAYLAFSYVSCHPERALPADPDRNADAGAVDSLLRLAEAWENDHDALQHWAGALAADIDAGLAAGIHPELARSGLQFRISRVLGEGHRLIYDTPAWISGTDLTTSWEQLRYAVTLLYLSWPGDFILLHLVTSLHAMEQIAARLPVAQRLDVVKAFWIGMLGIIFSGADFPKPAKLAALHATFADAVDRGGPQHADFDWKQIVARAVAEEEEHNPKLVYVLRRWWQDTGGRTIYRAGAGQFTATPELPPSFDEPPIE
jgi:hypothetical protein